jgi:hypothetical protein
MLRDFKRPDLKAPRFRPGVLQVLNQQFCKKVRKAHKEWGGLSDADIKAIIHTCGDVVQEQVIALRDGVELPEQLGYLFIGSTPATRKGNIDYKRSIELGKEVRHRNWETDELTGKIFYTNYGAKYRFKHRDVWKFEPVRQFKRAVAAQYPALYQQYVKVDSNVKVSWMFKR